MPTSSRRPTSRWNNLSSWHARRRLAAPCARASARKGGAGRSETRMTYALFLGSERPADRLPGSASALHWSGGLPGGSSDSDSRIKAEARSRPMTRNATSIDDRHQAGITFFARCPGRRAEHHSDIPRTPSITRPLTDHPPVRPHIYDPYPRMPRRSQLVQQPFKALFEGRTRLQHPRGSQRERVLDLRSVPA
jgi:hypothetical protein